VYDEIPYQIKQGQAIGASLQKIWKSHNEDTNKESASVACSL